MNHIYRVIWNRVSGVYQAVSETAKGHGKSKKTAVALALMTLGSGAFAQALPAGGSVVAGAGTISQAGKTLTITQSTDKLATDWQSFNVGAGHTVTFVQPSANSVALNRVLGPDVSVIQGAINANGHVFLVNPNGILFTPTAQVNVGGLVASTLSISNADFMSGNYKFDSAGHASVTNEGVITAHGGTVALIAAKIINTGSVQADRGNVLFGAGEKVTLDLGGTVKLSVTQGVIDALVNNGGAIRADGGLVYLTAKSAGELAGSVINNIGVIQARTMQGLTGTIMVLADEKTGTVNVGGTLDASAAQGDGGFIETSAAHVKISGGVKVTTAAVNGKTGAWLIDPVNFTVAATGGDMTGTELTAALGDSNIEIMSSAGAVPGAGDVNVNDAVSWSKNTLTLTAAHDVNVNAVMTASGTAALALNTGAGNGLDAGVAGGAVKMALGDAGFTGRVDFAGRSGEGFLNINGDEYTVINSLGERGSLTGTDLQGMRGDLTKNYALGENIDASATAAWSSGFNPVGSSNSKFTGRFNGLGHTVDDLVINRVEQHEVGLFGNTATGASNIGIERGQITGAGLTGSLAGVSGGITLNSYATGDVVAEQYYGGNFVGGLIGRSDADVINSHAKGTVSSLGYLGVSVGGLVGSMENGGDIKNSFATGDVSGGYQVGGLVGINVSKIEDSYATGNVTVSPSATFALSNFGGLAGTYANISNSHASGSVTTPLDAGRTGGLFDYVGGLGGYGYGNGTVSNSFATGDVVGSHSVGGLIGLTSGNVDNSFSAGKVTGVDSTGGLIGTSNFGVVSSSYATGSVDGTGVLAMNHSNEVRHYSVGGLIGVNGGLVKQSYSTGSVVGMRNVGGLVGTDTGTPGISNSFATGSVSGLIGVGGLVGETIGSIDRAYSTGRVQGQMNTGAFAGLVADQASITNSFWDKGVNGELSGVGDGRQDGVVGMSTSDMKQAVNFISATAANGHANPGWEFKTNPIWGIDEAKNSGYPFLCVFGGLCVLPVVVPPVVVEPPLVVVVPPPVVVVPPVAVEPPPVIVTPPVVVPPVVVEPPVVITPPVVVPPPVVVVTPPVVTVPPVIIPSVVEVPAVLQVPVVCITSQDPQHCADGFASVPTEMAFVEKITSQGQVKLAETDVDQAPPAAVKAQK